MSRARPEKRVTPSSLESAAVRHLARHGGTTEQLRQALWRQGRQVDGVPSELGAWIEAAIAYCERLGYLDDARFAEGKIRSMRQRGASERKIRAALGSKGVDEAVVNRALADAGGDEFEAALRTVRRRGFGRDPGRAERELASLTRGGFDVETARRALSLAHDELARDELAGDELAGEEGTG